MRPTGLALSAEKYELLSLALKEVGLVRQDKITRRIGLSTPPLSFAQQRLWFLDQLEPGNPQYNTPMGARLRGPLDITILQRALQEIVQRHEALRTVFPAVDGHPVQLVLARIDLPLEVIDLALIPETEREARAQELTDLEGSRPFDLSTGPLTRTVLLRLANDEHWLLVLTHHMVFDGWSVGLFARELAALYEAFADGKPSPLPELPIQYVDFAVWQRERLQGKFLEEHIDYWKRKIGGAPEVLKLPTDRPRPAVQRFRGRIETFSFSGVLAKSLNELARKEKTTMFVVLMSAFQVLLCRYSGQEDMVVSAGIANRNRSEVESLIGCFINILLLRADLAGDPTFLEMLRRVHNAGLEAHAHQDLPFEQLVAVLRPQRDLSYSPLAQVMMVLHNAAIPVFGFHKITLGRIRVPEKMAAQYDLLIHFTESENGLLGRIEYNSDLFDASTISRVIRNLETLLHSVAEDPTKAICTLPLIADYEWRQIVIANNHTGKDFPRNQCLHELFETQVERDPEAVAVIAGEHRLKYGELNAHANALAARLCKSGVRPESIVAICLCRSVELVIGLMAILKAGGTYLPLDPDYPSDRLSFMLADSGAKILITQQAFLPRLSCRDAEVILFEHDWHRLTDKSVPNPKSGITPDGLAYLIYTSGSTGRPKGAMLNHRGRVNNFFDFNDRFSIGPGDRIIALSSPSFDMCAYDVFGTLAAGAAIVLPDRSVDGDPKYWSELMIRHGVSIWHSVPSLLELLVDAWGPQSTRSLPALRVVLLGGDWIAVTLPDRIRRIAPGAQVISLGGATEVSMDSIIYPIGMTDPTWTSIPYGKPMTNQLAYVLDSRFEPVPIGVCGELCLGGLGLGRGYHCRPDVTSEKFIPNPFNQQLGDRLYRTGDLARWLANGNLELLGRIDHQVKVRGFRIELGEVKTALERHPNVKEAEVLMIGNNADAKRLVAYIVPKREEISAGEVQAFLRATLPTYMVPGALITLKALPLSPNGKVERSALPTPDMVPTVRETPAEPSDATEAEIRRIWVEVLGKENIGVNDDFFEIGGDSFQGITMLQRLSKRVSLMDFLKRPTIKGLAQRYSRKEEQVSSVLLQLTKQPKTDAPVLVCIPYGGGSAIVYQPLAKALGEDVDVRAVMLPGHDINEQQADLKPLEGVARLCAEEITAQVQGPMYLYGHCSGSALTIEIARLLDKGKANLQAVFIGGAYPWFAGKLTRLLRRLKLTRRLDSDHDVIRYIQSLGGIGQNFEVTNLDFVARAFKHDGACAEQYFKNFPKGWFEGRIAAPIVCIIADDDPVTQGYRKAYRRWDVFTNSVELIALESGGHYFVKGQATQLSGIIAARCKPKNREVVTGQKT